MLNTSSTPPPQHSEMHRHVRSRRSLPSRRKRARASQALLVALGLTVLVALSIYQKRDHPELHAALSVRPSSKVSSTLKNVLLLQADDDECDGECKPFDSSVQDRCAYIQEDCACESIVEDGLGNYLALYFCDLSSVNWLAIILMIILIIYLFLAIGLVAEEFFSPTMASIADTLGLSHNVAGVTLLAFANGAPDVFASFSALTGNKEELGIGALYGAGSFITMVVIGLVCWVKPGAPVTRRPVFRDAFFLVVTVLTVYVFTAIGQIHIYEAILVFLLYVIYVVVVIVSRIIYQRSKATERMAAKSAWGDEPAYSAAARATAKREAKRTPTDAESSTGAAAGAAQAATTPTSSSSSGGGGFEPYKLQSVETPPGTPPKKWSPSESATDMLLSPAQQRAHQDESSRATADYGAVPVGAAVASQHSPVNGDASLNAAALNDFIEADTSAAQRDRLLSDITYDFDEADEADAKGRFERAIDTIIKPVYLLARITIPLVEPDKWDWRLALVWPVVFFPFTFFVFDGFLVSVGPVPLMPFLVAFGIAVSAFMYYKLRTRRHKPIYSLFFLGLAFFAGVAWISLMADELVTVLAVLGVITGINQTILGITILAWGNSVPDAVANVTVAKFGYPQMAVGAALGGPIFNLLIGVGVSFTVNAAKQNPFPVPGNGNITLATIFIVSVVLMHMFFIVTSGWRLTRIQGTISFSMYFVFIVLSILIAVDIMPNF